MSAEAEIILDHLHGDDYPNWRESESARDMVRKVEQGLEKISAGGQPGHTAAETLAAPVNQTNPELVLPVERGEILLFASGTVPLPP